MANAYQVAEGLLGKSIDLDGYPKEQPYQCIDLVVKVASEFGVGLSGNGNMIGLTVTGDAEVINNPTADQLQVGDILSTNSTAAPEYGHTLVWGGGTYENATWIDQNAPNPRVEQHVGKSLSAWGLLPVYRAVRIKKQDNYKPSGASSNDNTSTTGSTSTSKAQLVFYEITCDEVKAQKSKDDTTSIDTFFKCNKVAGELDGDFLSYYRYDGSRGYLPKKCVALREGYNKSSNNDTAKTTEDTKVEKKDTDKDKTKKKKDYTLNDFITAGTINWGNYDWVHEKIDPTIYNPGSSKSGFVVDKDGYIVLNVPASFGVPVGTTYDTPFGLKGRVIRSDAKGTAITVYTKK